MGTAPSYGGTIKTTTDWGVNQGQLIYSPQAGKYAGGTQVIPFPGEENFVPNFAQPTFLPSQTLRPLPFQKPASVPTLRPSERGPPIPPAPIAPGQIYTPNVFEHPATALLQDRSAPPRWLMFSGRENYQPFVIGGIYKTSAGVRSEINPPAVLSQSTASQGVVAEFQPAGFLYPQWPSATGVHPDYTQSVDAPTNQELAIVNEHIEVEEGGTVVNFNGGQPAPSELGPVADSVVQDENAPTTNNPFIDSQIVGMYPWESQNTYAVVDQPDSLSDDPPKEVMITSTPFEHQVVLTDETPAPYCVSLPFGTIPMGQNPNEHHATFTANDQQGASVADVVNDRLVINPNFAKSQVDARNAYARNRFNVGPDMEAAEKIPFAPGQLDAVINESGLPPTDYEGRPVEDYSDLIRYFNEEPATIQNTELQESFHVPKGFYTNVSNESPFFEQAQKTVYASLLSTENRWGLAAS
jgi:hypothetical protein